MSDQIPETLRHQETISMLLKIEALLKSINEAVGGSVGGRNLRSGGGVAFNQIDVPAADAPPVPSDTGSDMS